MGGLFWVTGPRFRFKVEFVCTSDTMTACRGCKKRWNTKTHQVLVCIADCTEREWSNQTCSGPNANRVDGWWLFHLLAWQRKLRSDVTVLQSYKKMTYFLSICPICILGLLGWYGVSACVFVCACVRVCVCVCARLPICPASSLIHLHTWCWNVSLGGGGWSQSTPSHLPPLNIRQQLHHRGGSNLWKNISLCTCSPAHVFLLQFTELGMFETVWQVKYYNYNKRDHCQWGNSFNSIEYECKPNDTRTLMWVNKEMFV